jgi:hypothetical protein
LFYDTYRHFITTLVQKTVFQRNALLRCQRAPRFASAAKRGKYNRAMVKQQARSYGRRRRRK